MEDRVLDVTRSREFDPIMEAARLWTEHGWGERSLAMAAITSIMRVHQILLGRVNHELKELDLTFARYEVLMLLHFSRRGALPLVIIGERLQVHPTSVTSAVAKLESQGLVKKQPDPNDGRIKLVTLTASGHEHALRATQRLNRTVFKEPGLPGREVQQLVRILKLWRENTEDFS